MRDRQDYKGLSGISLLYRARGARSTFVQNSRQIRPALLAL